MADIRAFDIDVETKQTPRGVSLKRVERGDGKFLKALITMVADENGLLPGEVGYTEPGNKLLLVDAAGKSPGDDGYVGPVVQTPILKIVTDDILYADLTTDSYTFSSAVDAIAIKNDGTSNLTITIATLLFTIKPGESRIIEMAPFTVVAFSANATFRMNGLRRS